MSQHLGQNDLGQNVIGEEKPKEIKEKAETGKNGTALTTTTSKEVVTKTTDVDVVAQIRSIVGGSISRKTVQGLIQDKSPENMIALAKYSKEHAQTNPGGYFRRLVEQEAEPLEQRPKTEQTGDMIFDAMPDQVIELIREKLPGKDNRGIRNVLVEIHNRYNERHIGGEFHKVKWKLEVYEIEEMVAIAQEVLEEISEHKDAG